eukprot:32879_1
MLTSALFSIFTTELGILILTVSIGIVWIVIYNWRNLKRTGLKVRNIPLVIVDDYTSCDKAIIEFLSFNPSIIGMDCEWKPYFDKKENNTVSLIQLCHHKQCLLIRIQKIIHQNNGAIPVQLLELLRNPQILKTGLNLTGDAKKLYFDYQISVRGCVELQHLIQQKCCFHPSIHPSKHNICRLDVLSTLLLHAKMEKSKEITLSNWENDPLSDKQMRYAADDAIISYYIFMQCVYHRLLDNISMLPHDPLLCFDVAQYLADKTDAFFLNICEGIIDVKVIKLEQKIDRKRQCKAQNIKNKDSSSQRLLWKQERKQKYRERASRSKPLYENCRLLAMDGHLISSCSKKTLKWYLRKGLADQVNESTIQLKFEAKNDRTSADKFYQTLKKNECVVCGTETCLVKYYIVPQSYRKHFPLSIKAHSSHDIVLLCHDCHQVAAVKEDGLRRSLCDMYNITLWNEPIVIDKELMSVSKAAKTYLKCSDVLPTKRKEEILDLIMKSNQFNLNSHDQITDSVLKKAVQLVPNNEQIAKLKQEKFAKHTKEMVDSMDGDYMRLIKTWRQHFVQEMNPRFLPEHWSIDSAY